MPFDINDLAQFNDEEVEGLREAQASWKEASEFPPPPKPGKDRVVIAEIRDCKQTERGILTATVDLEIRGGELDGRRIVFHRANSAMFDTKRGRTSGILDMLMSFGANGAVSNRQMAQELLRIKDQGVIGTCQHDWQGRCGQCAIARLKSLTGQSDDKMASASASREQNKEANKFAMKFKNYRAFPAAGNEKQDLVKCPDCGNDIRAMAVVTRWIAPVAQDEVPF